MAGLDSVAVRSAVPDRATYLQRPDLGRRLDPAAREILAAAARPGGVDAALVNDYRWLKERLHGSAAQPLATGIAGYFLAGALRSAPRAALERRPAYCEIVNDGGPAHRLDTTGRQVGPAIRRGELLYAGPCMLAAASTVPFYGFGMRAFPFASDRPGSMQLRLLTRIAVPAVITSSTISTLRPASGAPISVPPSPCALASLRLKASGRSRPRRAYSQASAVASGMPL